ncbi:MAG: DUF5067 domain-containing protein [Clostridia bacterium]|nr:DUF5067 domain-containing protein [Clostridia bacterium]
MKKVISLFLAILLIGAYGIFALGSGESETVEQGKGTVQSEENKSNLGDYKVEILSCRLAKSFDDKSVVIVKYNFTNYSEQPTAFFTAFDTIAYQNDIGLNNAYILKDNANYSADNQTKEIKKDANLDVEVAYELNDTTTDIVVEVEELFSFSDKKITKTFSIK